MQKKTEYTLAELAAYLGAELQGEASFKVNGLASLPDATQNDISFVSDARYVSSLSNSCAGAIIVRAEYADQVRGSALVCDDPYLGFAKISRLFDDRPPLAVGVHATAQIAADAIVSETAAIGPYVVVEAGARIESGVEIGAGCFVGAGVKVGQDYRFQYCLRSQHKRRLPCVYQSEHYGPP